MKFSKIIVVTCIACIIVYTIFAMIAFFFLGAEPETLTVAVYGFFGTALCAMVVNRILVDGCSVTKKRIEKKNAEPKG